MADFVYYLTNLLFSIFHYYLTNISSGDIYLPLDISLSSSFVSVSELFSGKVLETLVILLAMLLPINHLLLLLFFNHSF